MIYTPSIERINAIAKEQGCNCRVSRQWVRKTASRVETEKASNVLCSLIKLAVRNLESLNAV